MAYAPPKVWRPRARNLRVSTEECAGSMVFLRHFTKTLEKFPSQTKREKLVKNHKKLMAALSLSIAASLVSTTAASATTCNANTLCLYEDINYGGAMLPFLGPTGGWVFVGNSFNDLMSSWINNLAYDARWSVDINGGGATYCLNSGSQNAQVISSRNDLLSAVIVYSNNAIC